MSTELKKPQITYGTTGDELKPFHEVMLPDVRQQHWCLIDPEVGIQQNTLEKFHRRVSELQLNRSVPEEIRISFDTARNLFIYSWFVYRFTTVAQFHAYATLELALRMRMKQENKGRKGMLKSRLDFAIKRRWLKAEEIRIFKYALKLRKQQVYSQFLSRNPIENAKADDQESRDYLKRLTVAIPKLRNTIAHGEPMLAGGSYLTLEICRDLINQLFPTTTTAPGQQNLSKKTPNGRKNPVHDKRITDQ